MDISFKKIILLLCFLRYKKSISEKAICEIISSWNFPNYGKRPLYSETKERIKQLRKTEYQIDLIMKNDCTTVEDLEDAINESLDSIKNLKDQEKEHRTEVRSYQKEWSKYEKLEELEGAFLLFQEGNESFKKEALEYQKLKDVVKQFPHTKDELRKFLDHETAYEKKFERKFV